MISPVNTIVRTAVDLGLKGARLPLSAYEAVARNGQSSADWAPAIAFESFEASVKGAAAKLTGDEKLATVSSIQARKVEVREEAIEQEAEAKAEAERAQAKAEAERRRLADAERAAAERAEAKERAVEEKRRKDEQEAAARARKREEASRKASAAREEVIEREATEAKAEALARKEAALEAKQAAVATRAAESNVEKQLRAKKAARKAS